MINHTESKEMNNNRLNNDLISKGILIDTLIYDFPIDYSQVLINSNITFNIDKFNELYTNNAPILINNFDISYNCLGSNEQLYFNIDESEYEFLISQKPNCTITWGGFESEEFNKVFTLYNNAASATRAIDTGIDLLRKQKLCFESEEQTSLLDLEACLVVNKILDDYNTEHPDNPIAKLLTNVSNATQLCVQAFNNIAALQGQVASDQIVQHIIELATESADILMDVAYEIENYYIDISSDTQLLFIVRYMSFSYSRVYEFIPSVQYYKDPFEFDAMLRHVITMLKDAHSALKLLIQKNNITELEPLNKYLTVITESASKLADSIDCACAISTPLTITEIEKSKYLVQQSIDLSMEVLKQIHEYNKVDPIVTSLYTKFSTTIPSKKCKDKVGVMDSVFYQQIDSLMGSNIQANVNGLIGCYPFTASAKFDALFKLSHIKLAPINIAEIFHIPSDANILNITEIIKPELSLNSVIPNGHYSTSKPNEFTADILVNFNLNGYVTISYQKPINVLTPNNML
ncbi:MAG TPA: hypothetical protein DG753_08210 [Clostridium sp.]|nr:hypothetical protein [Clostridium sp.]